VTSTLQLLGDELTKVGFGNYAIGSGFHSGDLQFLSTYSDDWQAHYFDNNFASIDPLPYCALSCSTPIRWSDVRKRMKKSPVMNAASDFGLKQGFGLSCGGYVISTHHDGELTDNDLSFIHTSMSRIARTSLDAVEPLTNSQMGLVDLLGLGLQMDQIASILGISSNSLKSNKRRLFQKYNCNSDAQLLRVLRNQ